MKQTLRALATMAAVLGAGMAQGQSSNHAGGSAHAGHGTHGAQQPTADANSPSAILPKEGGNGAFAAVAEIVGLLSTDPATDWSRVDIGALRDHLVDMDRLITDTQVRMQPVDGGADFLIAVPDRQASAAARMVPAHAPVLAAETGWDSTVADLGDHLVWTVTGDAERIRALGFFGLMATGDHHRAHHLALARGQAVH